MKRPAGLNWVCRPECRSSNAADRGCTMKGAAAPAGEERSMDLRTLQRPLKEQYRQDATAARITLRADGRQTGTPLSCAVDLGRVVYPAEVHPGVGGPGTAACSGDLLLGAL